MQSYHHFTLEERESLRIYLTEGKSNREIGRLIGKSPSSIGREVARNRNKDGAYHPWRATILYIIRRKKSVRQYRLSVDPEMQDWVKECLNSYWSPEIITARWKMIHPGEKLSHSTIYRALKKKLLPGYSPRTHLRRHGRRKYDAHANTNSIQPEHLIREWDKKIHNRTELGHWEGDTIYGAIGKGLLVTCVDRKSRYLAAALLRNRERLLTKDAVVCALQGHKVLSLSLDNGSEFAAFKQIEQELNTIVYFADPHSPWQRPSNENINGLLRFFFPKGTSFHEVTQENLDSVLTLINNRPRKCLGWLSPVEFLRTCCT
jgi:IS30 family transposase